MKKVLSLICALFVTVAFAGVTLAADKGKEMKPTATDNAMKAPKKKVEKAPEKPMEEKPMEKKY